MNEKEQDKLTALLRDVHVPADLRDRLLRIAHDDVLPTGESAADTSLADRGRLDRAPAGETVIVGRHQWPIWVIALVACTIGALVMLNWPRTNRDQPKVVRDEEPIRGSDHSAPPESARDSALAAAGTLDVYDEAIRQLDLQLAMHELDRVEAELERVRRQNVRASLPATLSAIDDVSGRLALARLAARDFGASDDIVREDMNRIMLDYPQSLGSELAAAALKEDLDLKTLHENQ